jgi:hypothetical protein
MAALIVTEAAMSDNVLSVIPADLDWQPTSEAADAAMAVLQRLAPQLDGFVTTEYRTTWHEQVAAVDCGGNLERIECPACQNAIDVDWWADLLEERFETGFTNLTVTVPCCGAEVSLNDLRYDWPCGFARFELEAWNPNRDWLTADELAQLAAALGCDVRQVLAHI